MALRPRRAARRTSRPVAGSCSPQRIGALPALAAIPALAALVLVLAGCAPAASGAGARVDYAPEATYRVAAGEALHVRIRLPLEETGLTVERLRRARLNWLPLGVRGESANLAALVDLPSAQAPEGWEVRLWQVRAVRERPLGQPDAPFTYRVDAELRVDVPASAEGLLRRTEAQLRFADGETVPLTFLVRAD